MLGNELSSHREEIVQWITLELYIQLRSGHLPLSSPLILTPPNQLFFPIKSANSSTFPILVGGPSIFQHSRQCEKFWSWLLFLSPDRILLTRSGVSSS